MKNAFSLAAALVLFFGFFVFPFGAKAESSVSELIIVNKAANKLAYYDGDGNLVEIYSVATGRSVEFTPEGKFSVANKMKNVPYYKARIPGGAPNNPLGDRWIGLSVPGTNGTLYGIHGNNNENSIGTYASAGCVRMHNEEVRALFEQVSVGAPVIIANSPGSFQEIAKQNGYEVFPSKEEIAKTKAEEEAKKKAEEERLIKEKAASNAKMESLAKAYTQSLYAQSSPQIAS